MAALSSSGRMGEDGCTPAEPRPAALCRGAQGWDRGRARDCSGHHQEVCLCCVTRAQNVHWVTLPTFHLLSSHYCDESVWPRVVVASEESMFARRSLPTLPL